MNLGEYLKDSNILPKVDYRGDTTCCVNAKPNFGRYEASLEVVWPPRKTCNSTVRHINSNPQWNRNSGLTPALLI